jgi:hypothetical protein
VLRALLALVLPTLTLASAYQFFAPVRLSNDDTVMEMLARGIGVASTPTPQLIFMHVYMGKLLTALYNHWPSVAWYRVLMLSAHWLATATLCAIAFQRGFRLRTLWVLSIYLLCFDLPFYIWTHFTIVAALPAQAAIAWWCGRCLKGQSWRFEHNLGFLALIALSALIRHESCLMVLLVALPIGPLALAMRWHGTQAANLSKLNLLSYLAPFLYAGALVSGLRILNSVEYARTPGWEAYYEYNWLRAQLTDYQRATYTTDTKPAFDRVGWSHNDFLLLVNWFFENPDLYSAPKLRAVLEELPFSPSQAAYHEFARLSQGWTGDANLQAMLLANLLIFALGAEKPSTRALWAVGVGTSAGAAGLILCILGHLPPWAAWPLLSLTPSLAVATSGSPDDQTNQIQPWLLFLAFGALLVLFCRTVEQAMDQSNTLRIMNRNLRSAIDRLQPRRDELYVVWGNLFPFELILGADDMDNWRAFRMLSTGFLSQSPVNRARLKEFAIDDVYRAVFERPNVYLISRPAFIPMLVQYAKEHFGKNLTPQLVFRAALAPPGPDSSMRQYKTTFQSLWVFHFCESPDVIDARSQKEAIR